jgi:hypothetical protein
MVPSAAMSRSLIFAVLTLFAAACQETPQPAPPPAAQPEAASPAAAAPAIPAADHDVTGAYFPVPAWPPEFAELDFLSLATIDENAAPAPLNGFLRPKEQAAKDFALVSPSLASKSLTFTTAAVDGVHFTFTGTFEVLGKFPENPPGYETVVLSGTLTKLRNGTTVASTPVKFRYEAGG